MIQTILQGFCKLVFPPYCLKCRTKRLSNFPHEILCSQCLERLEHNIPPFCPLCSRHLNHPHYLTKCHSCTHNELHFDFAWSSLIYNDTLKNLLHRFKFNQKTLLKYFFTQTMISFILRHGLDIQQFDYLMTVPLHSTRYRERGFNQAELLAVGISQYFSIPLLNNHLIKIRPTHHQSLSQRKDRFTNLKGAFRIQHSKKIDGKNILLVDDLITTGMTASETALTLKNAGAKKVGVLTLAITT